MEQRGNYAAVKDAQIKPSKEECALKSMGQRSIYAAAKDAQIKLSKEEFAGGMGLRSTHRINLLHLDQNLNRLLQLKNELREQPPEDKEEVSFPER